MWEACCSDWHFEFYILLVNWNIAITKSENSALQEYMEKFRNLPPAGTRPQILKMTSLESLFSIIYPRFSQPFRFSLYFCPRIATLDTSNMNKFVFQCSLSTDQVNLLKEFSDKIHILTAMQSYSSKNVDNFISSVLKIAIFSSTILTITAG